MSSQQYLYRTALVALGSLTARGLGPRGRQERGPPAARLTALVAPSARAGGFAAGAARRRARADQPRLVGALRAFAGKPA